VLHGHYLDESAPIGRLKLQAYYRASILLRALILVNNILGRRSDT
jgi:hypothetical protein